MVDLHLHSNCSDGSDTPECIAELAHSQRLSAFALTDHDTCAGLDAAADAADSLGINIIYGSEISLTHRIGTLHVLLYFSRASKDRVDGFLASQRHARSQRNAALIQKFQSSGIGLTQELLASYSPSDNLGRSHFAKGLVELGFATNIQDAFEKYLSKNSPFYIPKATLKADEVARAAQEMKALAVLAHPFSLEMSSDRLAVFVKELKELGFSGLESHYGRYTPSERAQLLELAKTNALIATGGSDYHGSFKSGLEVGVGEGDLEVPDSSGEELMQALAELG